MNTSPYWITCEHCGEKRDASTRYTSPANAERDRRRWKEEHLSGLCLTPTSSDHQDTPSSTTKETNVGTVSQIIDQHRIVAHWKGNRASTAECACGHTSEFLIADFSGPVTNENVPSRHAERKHADHVAEVLRGLKDNKASSPS